MKVLMFGWEFPPHIAGGLGTACEGIVKGLAHNGVETFFVMPSASGDEDTSATTIINASDVVPEYTASSFDEYMDKVKFCYVDSNLVPYMDPDEYYAAIEKMKKEGTLQTAVASDRSSGSPESTAPTSWRKSHATPWWPALSQRSARDSST